MDVSMPVMDGQVAAREIRKLGGASGRTPIVALTANAMAGDREACLEAGMNDYVPKPIMIRNVLDAIGRNLQPEVRASGDAPDPAEPPHAADRVLSELEQLLASVRSGRAA
jgi:CheY-like chemotaxis protein